MHHRTVDGWKAAGFAWLAYVQHEQRAATDIGSDTTVTRLLGKISTKQVTACSCHCSVKCVMDLLKACTHSCAYTTRCHAG
jgi:hypothetical protein